ncbi:HAD-IC family P-type ATPase [Intestinibacter bartlettii]|uniref:HAD-IC family P-type ATPase n=1 Tax=Intestinibacter bartlettii TaxID=261299 RepID=A0ABS6DUX5_9FIRM|nr:HAD-IC family P-type ATPase [Intestinibacter bartlettii]MBU5335101.1 HAD-IC family P-type ATPase [Intestinibacter bartlettii]
MQAKSHSHRKSSIGEEPPPLQSKEEHSKRLQLKDSNWYKVSQSETLNRLNSNKDLGLSEEDIISRRSKYGKNNLTESKKQSKLVRFLKQFNNSVIYILLVAGVFTLFIGHISDTVVIGIVVLVNALIGYIQENKAESAISKIKQMLVVNATVIREGQRIDIDASELVLGDIVYLEAGDSVPADIRILEANNLKIQESVLTGEADSVQKNEKTLIGTVTVADQTNMAFASTSVTNGDMTGIVVATGDYTEIGKINQSINDVKQEKTPLIISINNLGKYISYAIVLVAVLLFGFGVLFKIYEIPVLLLSVITMVVGSIPEGLPAITSVILAIGVQNMARKNSIVKNLPSVETLGSVNIIGTDKTGTLTKNEMTVKDIIIQNHQYIVTGDGYSPDGEIFEMEGKEGLLTNKSSKKIKNKLKIEGDLKKLILIGALANDATLNQEEGKWIINGEPTDGCFLTLCKKANLDTSDFVEIDKIPFDSDFKYMAKIVDLNEERYLVVKGAPDKLMDIISNSNSEFDKTYWQNQMTLLAKQGKRVVAVAYKKISQDIQIIEHKLLRTDLILVGLVGIMDPPKEQVIDAIMQARNAGVKVKMITGDHPDTAVEIARQIKLSDENRVITGPQLDKLTDTELSSVIQDYDIFARATPENKLRIVKAYQANNLITAMTGDGVNDAPALKQADIGISMGIKGTDVAKESSDMVLADDNFSTIVDAIKEGRRVYDNIKKTIKFLLPTSIAEGLIVLISIILNNPLPLEPVQLLWINMVSAITISFAFVFEPVEKDAMNKKPRQKNESIIKSQDTIRILYVATLIAGLGLIISQHLTSLGISKDIVSTVTLNIVVFCKIFYLFNIRTEGTAISKNLFTNKIAFLVVAILIVLQMMITYLPQMHSVFRTAPLQIKSWLYPLYCGFIVFSIVEIEKFLSLKLRKIK